MRKRIISLLLLISMLLPLLAGCNNTTSVVAPTEGSESIATTKDPVPTIPAKDDDSSEPETNPTQSVANEPTTADTVVTTPESTTSIPPATQPQETIPVETAPTETTPTSDSIVEEEQYAIETPQRKAINMVNYITVLTEEINVSKGSRVYLDSVKDSLKNNLALSAIDSITKTQINNLWKTIDEYSMIDTKRARLEFTYEQNKAQAMREAVPDPLSLLNVVQSKNKLEAIASVLYMAIDAKTSYERAATEADMEYLQAGWELDDAETKELSTSQLNLLNYMIDMSNQNEFPDEWVLKSDEVADFVEWVNKENLVSKINWLEDHENTYREFRTYWLELAQSYYYNGNFDKCLEAFEAYKAVATRIFDKDLDYAKALPLAIIAAKNEMSPKEYEEFAKTHLDIMLNNCDDEDWALRYFATQSYIDLYACTDNRFYLNKAYRLAFNSVNVLVYEQDALNKAYVDPIKKATAEKGISKRQKDEIKEYNDFISDKRKTELPPVNEFFYLNCELLFALAEELDISHEDRVEIDDTIHAGGNRAFITEFLDNRFWASQKAPAIKVENIDIEFSGNKLVLPASCITDRYSVTVTVSDGTVLNDWKVEEVKRPKNSTTCSEFMVVMTHKESKNHKFSDGDLISITVTPVTDSPDQTIEFKYQVVGKKTLGVIKSVEFERIK